MSPSTNWRALSRIKLDLYSLLQALTLQSLAQNETKGCFSSNEAKICFIWIELDPTISILATVKSADEFSNALNAAQYNHRTIHHPNP